MRYDPNLLSQMATSNRPHFRQQVGVTVQHFQQFDQGQRGISTSSITVILEPSWGKQRGK